MSRTAIALLNAGKLELTEYVESFTYEESVEKDNLLEIRVKDTHSLEMTDSPNLVPGNGLSFQFGYMGERLSPVHKLVITDMETSYSSRISLSVRGTDQGASMKKGQGDKVWKNLTASEIAQKIALANNLKAVVDKTTTKLGDLPQGGKSDFEFLRDLAQKESSGHYEMYITDGVLHFTKRNLGKRSSITYTYGTDSVISFAPRWRETTAPPEANEVKTVGVDPRKKKVLSTTDNKTDGTTLSEAPLVVRNSNAQALGLLGNGKRPLVPGRPTATTGTTQSANVDKGKTSGWEEVKDNLLETGKKLLSPTASSPTELAKAKHKKNAAKLKILEATLTTPLNPNIRAGMVLTIGGVAKRHSGNWYVTSVRHSIGGGTAAKTVTSLGKESIKKTKGATTKLSAKSNTTVGGKEVAAKKQVMVVRSADGVEIGRIREGSKRPVK